MGEGLLPGPEVQGITVQFSTYNSLRRGSIAYRATGGLHLCFLFSARRDDDKRTGTAEQEARHTDVEVQIALIAAFPEARGSRIEASQIYALNRWTEAYGYE